MYKTLIYVFSIMLSMFALSGVNFDGFFKINYKNEAKIFIFIIAISLGYLVGSFIIEFLNVSQIL